MFASRSFGDKLDYSGFDYDNWIIRNKRDHNRNADIIQMAVTATTRASLEKQHGLRYSILLHLPNFDVQWTLTNPNSLGPGAIQICEIYGLVKAMNLIIYL